jgi:hypothetical protein
MLINYRFLYFRQLYYKTFEHALTTFPNLLHFLDFWVVYKRKKGISTLRQWTTQLPRQHNLKSQIELPNQPKCNAIFC